MQRANEWRSQIRGEVASITGFDRLEREHLAHTLQWVDSGVELCRVEKPATPPLHLVSYFVCTDGDHHVLLVDHRNAQLWLPTGGHVEPGEHPRTTVVREAQEELGIHAAFRFPQPLMLTVSETQGLSVRHTDVSFWYVLDLSQDEALAPDTAEFHEVRWFALHEVPLHRSEPHMRRFLQKLTALGC